MFFSRKKITETKTAEQQLVDIAGELIKQNKRTSRRRMLIAVIVLLYFGVIIFVGINQSDIVGGFIQQKSPFVAEISLSGTIAADENINNEDTTKLLKEAFSAANSKAVILHLNSGGGSPVQSSRIYNNINRLKKTYNKKLFVVIEDICTSGCYYIAAAADEIYADKSSIIGSIGVIMPSFDLTGAIDKLGIKRRLYTAGKYKGLLDMFSAEDKFVTKHIQEKVLNTSHQNFISDVKKGRGNRLTNDKKLFSGLIWLGKDAKKLGLIDGLGDAYFVANEIIGINNRVKYETKKTLLEEFTTFSFNKLFSIFNQQLNTKLH